MKKYILLFLPFFVISCSSKTPEKDVSGQGLEEFPSWVIDPQVENGIAASECIIYSGNISVDKAQITAQARSTLAKQIEVRVSALDKTYLDRTDAAGKTVVGSSFSSVSRQLSDQTLTGTRLTKLSRLSIGGQENLCGMLTLDPERSQTIFKQIIEASQREISVEDEDVLYQEFKAHRAQEDLDRLLTQE
jgi:hypothetical protein